MDHGCPWRQVIVTSEIMENNSNALAIVPRQTSMEVAASASAALAKATIEAKFAIAYKTGRDSKRAEDTIIAACKRPRFAEGAIYKKPGARKKNEKTGEWEPTFYSGLSIRFAECAIAAWGNVDVSSVTAWEDDDRRLVRITVTDLCSNLSYTDEAMLEKVVERKKLKPDQESIGTRTNQKGETVFLVRATEDELLNKVNSAKSKSIRNSGLRLVPKDILEYAEETIKATRAASMQDRAVEAKKIADAFNPLGVTSRDLEIFLGHKMSEVSADEIDNLRGIWAAIRDGEAKWSDYVPDAPTTAESKSVDPEGMFGPVKRDIPPIGTTVSKTVVNPDGTTTYTGPSTAAAEPPPAQPTPPPAKPKRAPRAVAPPTPPAPTPPPPPVAPVNDTPVGRLTEMWTNKGLDFPALCAAADNIGVAGLDGSATSLTDIPTEYAEVLLDNIDALMTAAGV